MKSRLTLRLKCHWLALLIETAGTCLVFFDAMRMDAQLHAAGFASYAGGAPPGYTSWYYHSAMLGFGLLLAGIMVGGIALVLEHRDLVMNQTLPHNSLDRTQDT
jgi:hypothetical protein